MIKIIKQFAGFLTLSYKLKIRARKSNTQCFTVLKSAKSLSKSGKNYGKSADSFIQIKNKSKKK